VKDGTAAVKEIIEFDKNADIIVASSIGTQSQLKAAIEAGARDFIQKPLSVDQIFHIITSRFEGR
jgi:two-component system chemotaxis response regulator CheY